MVKENDIITDGTTKWKVRRLGGSSDGNPVGTIIMYAANTMPEGYLLCDGSAVSRTNYAALFAVIGTTWGAGDGSTTFNLPNAVGRFPEGSATAGGYIEAGLPNITGSFVLRRSSGGSDMGAANGALYTMSTNPYKGSTWVESNTGQLERNIIFNAGNFNAIYGKAVTVQPSAIQYKQLIKYI